MKDIFIIIILFGILLTSCQTTSNHDKIISDEEETFIPTAPKDYIKQIINSLNTNDFNQLKNLKNDSIKFDSTLLYRTFIIKGDSIINIKYAIYSDSSYVLKHTGEMINLINSIIGEPKQSNPYSYKWIKETYSIKLKVFPKEGFDLNICKSSIPEDKSACVGDLYESILFLSTQLNEVKNNAVFSVNELDFDGINVIVSKNNIDLIYTCTTTQSLQQLDSKSIQNAISNSLGSSPVIKDGMSFWEINQRKFSYSKLTNGHQITLIQ